MTDLKGTNTIRRRYSPSKKLESDWDKEEIASQFCLSGWVGLKLIDFFFVLFFKFFDLFLGY